MSGSEDPIYRIICRRDTGYSLAIRGGNVVFVLTNPFDRYQHWIKDESHGATIMDSEGHPAFAVVNRATGQAICHGAPSSRPLLVPYNVHSCDKSVLWTMSKHVKEEYDNIRWVDDISVCWNAEGDVVYDGHLMDHYVPDDYHRKFYEGLLWKMTKVLPSTCISFFRPSQRTVKIICIAKVGFNLTIDKDGATVLLVPSNLNDIYQHWIKEEASHVPVKYANQQKAFALVNKATGKAIKLGFGRNYLVQVAPFNRNYIDPSILWTESRSWGNDYGNISSQIDDDMVFEGFEAAIVECPLLGLSKKDRRKSKLWKIEDVE